MMHSRGGYGAHLFLNDHIRRNNYRKIMEVGVSNGENARAMVESALQIFSSGEVEYYGFDLFGGDNGSIMEVEQKLRKTGCKFRLFKGDSGETLPEAVKNLPKMDLIFIDGGHSYTTVKSDWEYSKLLMNSETAVFFHNYDFLGPKSVVDGISRKEYKVKIIHSESDYVTALVRKRV